MPNHVAPLLRRDFLERLSVATGMVVMAPLLPACGGAQRTDAAAAPVLTAPVGGGGTPGLPPIPLTKPEGWDAIAFNRDRGNAGAIPASYLASINGEDGVTKHLGKHLPYVPKLDPSLVPPGFLPLMWGDPAAGYAPHPNAPKNEKNNWEGHWYNWIRLRRATDGGAAEEESAFTGWPVIEPGDSGKYAGFGGADISANDGKDTIYLVALPDGVQSGDEVRIYAHCLTHGEYLDFLRLG